MLLWQAGFEPPKSLKLISRKIWVIEKFWNFHPVLKQILLKIPLCNFKMAFYIYLIYRITLPTTPRVMPQKVVTPSRPILSGWTKKIFHFRMNGDNEATENKLRNLLKNIRMNIPTLTPRPWLKNTATLFFGYLHIIVNCKYIFRILRYWKCAYNSQWYWSPFDFEVQWGKSKESLSNMKYFKALSPWIWTTFKFLLSEIV